MFQNCQKVAKIIELDSNLIEKFKKGVFSDLDPIFNKSIFVFYLIGYNFYEIELSQMITKYFNLDPEIEDDIIF
jgi:hypothetical protein